MAFKTLCLVLCLALYAMEAHGLKTFLPIRRNVDFFRAVQACRIMGGHLASIESADENTRLHNAIKAAVGTMTSQWWIGGMDYGNEGTFVWYSLNKPIVYKNYLPNEPNNFKGVENCLIIDGVSDE
ncbi:pulmonary surfactant-associated protein D-like [Anopheles moucheti]|uniref:pulmonary surfactant-associated protein D-like n=1 Tax=Anopheles moucheti TaxID=186751 RepID=UPI0022F10A20|nr:pulmonary surfactant-associated protein D-like [Anopheles moucheti]